METIRVQRRWLQRPEGANWGDFGDDDQLGSLNHIGAEQVRAAALEIRSGERFCLSLPLDYPGGQVLAAHRKPPTLQSTIRKGVPYFNYAFAAEDPSYDDVGSDDVVTLSTQYSTQWDSLAHIGYHFDADGDGLPESCFYNGYRAGRDITPPEQRRDDPAMPLGVDTFAARPVQGRGVLVDLEHHLGRGSRTVGLSELQEVMRLDGVEVRRGDILCIHTGFADELLRMERLPDSTRASTMCAALDGADERLHAWITSSGLAAIAADNFAVERIDPQSGQRCGCLLPLHRHCLFKRGIPLGELWYLTELAAWLRKQRRSAFMLTAPPLRLRGAVGSPVTPVATV